MQRILVPVDGSPAADNAVKHVIATWKMRSDAEIHLLHVQPLLESRDVPGMDRAGLGARLNRDEEDRMFASAKRLLGEAGVGYTAQIEIGEPAPAIAHYADLHACTEIVMGTRGMGTIRNLLLGSVAMKVLHLVEVPVTLVK